MRRTRSLIAACLLAVTALSPALATTVGLLNPNYFPSFKLDGIVSLTSAYSNATTGLTDITGLTITLPATTSQYAKQYIRVCYSLDAAKATSTTGAVEVYANGAAIADSKRYIQWGTGGQQSMSGCYVVARAAATATVVKLQGVSGDTAAFTVAAGQMEVTRWFQGG